MNKPRTRVVWRYDLQGGHEPASYGVMICKGAEIFA